MKKPRIILGSLFLVAVLVWTAFFTWPSKVLKISFLNVGQGDSIFVQSPSGYQMLIDGGPSNEVLNELGKEMPFWDKSIDLVVLTHPHSDHLTGLLEVVKRYNVGQILATDVTHTTPEFLEWLKIIKEQKIPFELSSQVSAIDLGAGAKADVLYPKESYSTYAKGYGGSAEALREGGKDKKIKDLNETSIVLHLEYAGISFLFTGDLEADGQKKLIENLKLKIENSQFLKVPHHGSKSALDLKFLEAVLPKVAIISVGKNSYGHPAKETLKKLEDRGIEIRRTDKDGAITVVVDTNGNWKIN